MLMSMMSAPPASCAAQEVLNERFVSFRDSSPDVAIHAVNALAENNHGLVPIGKRIYVLVKCWTTLRTAARALG